MPNEPYCDRALVLVDVTGLGVHDVSREVYDAVPGTDEFVHTPHGGAPVWSKVIATAPIKVKMFTFQPPRLAADQDTPVLKTIQRGQTGVSAAKRGE